MPKRSRARFVALVSELARRRADIDDPVQRIRDGAVRVDGVIVTNPGSRVRRDAAIVVREARPPRGQVKLAAALDGFGVEVSGRVALDVGAAAGGFTRALLVAGARRVYALDAGHGQLAGALRQDPNVVVLERVNLAHLQQTLVPDRIDVVTLDLSYLSIASAVPQLEPVEFATTADMVALVKPMFELHAGALPPLDRLEAARRAATAAIGAGRWRIVTTMPSPVPGRHGAREVFVHARRSP